MAIGVTEDHEALASSVRGWAERAGLRASAREALDGPESRPEWWRGLGEQGLLGLHVAEELGGSAWEAAIMSFVLFSVGAIVPVLPFLFMTGLNAVITSAVFATVALFILGGAITLFTGRPVLWSGLRQVVFGLVAAALTFGVGRLIGVAV